MGIELPKNIPDCAQAIISKKPTISDMRADNDRLIATIDMHYSFSWLELSFTV